MQFVNIFGPLCVNYLYRLIPFWLSIYPPLSYIFVLPKCKMIYSRSYQLPGSVPVKGVVYFDQQMGALHAVCWLKSFFSFLKQVFSSFSVTNRKKRKKKEKKAQK